METESRATATTRGFFAAAALLLGLYALNVALGMAAVKFGAQSWRLGDVGEFLLVLSGMACFVAGLTADEARHAAVARAVEGSSKIDQGGVR